MIEYGVYGDSIAFGYGNNNHSWFDSLAENKTALKRAQNGAKIADVAVALANDKNHYQTLFIAVGINDLLQPEDVPANNDIVGAWSCYETLLEKAAYLTDRLIVQSVLPVRENLFPKQEWLTKPMWAFNENIRNFNVGLQKLAFLSGASFIDAYADFNKGFLSWYYTDAVHLNASGQDKLFRIYQNNL